MTRRRSALCVGDGALSGLVAAATHPDLEIVLWVPWTVLDCEPVQAASFDWLDPRLVDLGPVEGPLDFRQVPGVVHVK